MDEQNPETQEDLGMGGKFKNWIQDNIRIIISVLIVVAIAGGIYSYSKRGEDIITEEELAMEQIEGETGEESAVSVVGEGENQETEEAIEEEVAEEDIIVEEDIEAEEVEANQEEADGQTEPETATETEEPQVAEEAVPQEEAEATKEDVKVDTGISEGTSEETAEAFMEEAVEGDSVTTLARKALKDYLEKNQDSSLTPEHKIYIEDYLRKNVDHTGGVYVGTTIGFSKNLIRDGIEKAKTLNEAQLDNLKKYSARVSNL